MIIQGDFEWLEKRRPYEWVFADHDPGAGSELERLCTSKHQRPLRAWRSRLDQDDVDYLSHAVFDHGLIKMTTIVGPRQWSRILAVRQNLSKTCLERGTQLTRFERRNHNEGARSLKRRTLAFTQGVGGKEVRFCEAMLRGWFLGSLAEQ